MTKIFTGHWSDAERRRLADRINSFKPDNGKMHYGMGLKGSLCGVECEHVETTRRELVKCGDCIRILRARP